MNDYLMKDNSSVLRVALEGKRLEWEATAPEATKVIYNEGVSEVRESGILEHALQVGSKAPDFRLTNATGKEVGLSEVLEKGPVILTRYRGGWCPYCNITLRHLQQHLQEFRNAGASLIALTPELADNSLSTREKHELQFEVLSDTGNKVAKKYGIVFKLNDEVANLYKEAFDLESYNGDDSHELPLAATYVIDNEGVIRYAFLDAEYRNRAEPGDILDMLERLK